MRSAGGRRLLGIQSPCPSQRWKGTGPQATPLSPPLEPAQHRPRREDNLERTEHVEALAVHRPRVRAAPGAAGGDLGLAPRAEADQFGSREGSPCGHSGPRCGRPSRRTAWYVPLPIGAMAEIYEGAHSGCNVGTILSCYRVGAAHGVVDGAISVGRSPSQCRPRSWLTELAPARPRLARAGNVGLSDSSPYVSSLSPLAQLCENARPRGTMRKSSDIAAIFVAKV